MPWPWVAAPLAGERRCHALPRRSRGRLIFGVCLNRWVEEEMYHDVLWMVRRPFDAGRGVPACMEGRCFVLRGEVQPLQELTIWWQRPVSLLALPDAHWTRLAEAADATLVPQPVLWNGQDTDNIFHLLVSFLSR
ncbi:unnamed protein product, partial [Effrenium voratum]